RRRRRRPTRRHPRLRPSRDRRRGSRAHRRYRPRGERHERRTSRPALERERGGDMSGPAGPFRGAKTPPALGSPKEPLPGRVELAISGGGIMGLSGAYQVAKMQRAAKKEVSVAVLERDYLVS